MSSVETTFLAERHLHTLYGLNFGRTLVAFMLYFKFPLYFEELGLSGSQRGDIFAMVPLFSIISTFWIGVVADRVDARYVIGAGLALLALFLAALSLTSNYWLFLLLFALNGVANQCFTVGSNAYFFKNVDKEQDKNIPISRFSASASLGIACAFIGGPWLVATVGLATALQYTAIVGLLFCPLVFRLPPATAVVQDLRGYFLLFRDPKVRLFMAMIFLFTFHWGTETTCYTPFLVHELGLKESHLGYFMAPPLLVLGASTLFFGHLGHRRLVGPHGILAAAFFCSGCGAIGMVSSSTVPAAFAWRLMHEVGDGAYFLFMLGGIHRLFAAERVGGCAALVWFTAMASAAISSALSAPLGASYGYALPQAGAGALALLSLVGLPFLLKKKEPRQQNLWAHFGSGSSPSA